MQRYFITIGIVLLILGILWPWLQKVGLFRLPGDIIIEKQGFNFYFPITSGILISIVISLIFWLFKKL